MNDFQNFAMLTRSRTKRLQEALLHLGLMIGDQAGVDVGSGLGINGSRDTILRLLRQSELSVPPEPHVIGLDDWAWKRRLRYGTLICDLEQGWPIDLLPDRAVETIEAWLRDHPSIEVVSRDGSSEYASAIKKGAPQARQVSDRWHLVKNLAACVSVQLAQSLTQLRRTEQARATTCEEEQSSPQPYSHPRTRAEQRTQQARQAERQARYEQITTLFKQGMKSAEIAAHVGMTDRTVRRWLSRRDIPYSRPRKPRPRLIDPYKAYLLSRWQQGCHNGAHLESELRAKGYKGSGRALYCYLETLEPSDFSIGKRSSASATGQVASREPNPLLALSAQQATWLFFRRSEDLKEEERERLRLLRQASPQIETAYQFVEKFLQMVRERTGEQLAAWLAFVEASHLEAFNSFVTGVQQDRDAVLAGLTLPWSNGPLEGNVNRLKLIKRSMYGRAEFDLLKLRVLHHSAKNQDRKAKKKNQQGQQQVGPLKQPKNMKNGTNFQYTTAGISKVA